MNTKEKNRTSSQDQQKRNNTEKRQDKSAQKTPPPLNKKNEEEGNVGKTASYEKSEEEPETPTKGLDVGDDPDQIKRKSPKMD